MNVLTSLKLYNSQNMFLDLWALSLLLAKSGRPSQSPLCKGTTFLGTCVSHTAFKEHAAATSLVKTQGRGVVPGTLEEVRKPGSSFLYLLALNDCEHHTISVQSPGELSENRAENNPILVVILCPSFQSTAGHMSGII